MTTQELKGRKIYGKYMGLSFKGYFHTFENDASGWNPGCLRGYIKLESAEGRIADYDSLVMDLEYTPKGTVTRTDTRYTETFIKP